MRNEIGDIGETIFKLAISRSFKFRPAPLGEKWPTSDFYVELIGSKENFFFIVQVKSTRQKRDSASNLKINVPVKKIKLLNNYYCPTYLAGVDINTEEAFLLPINKLPKNVIRKLPTTFVLNERNCKKLYKEVCDFWKQSGLKPYKKSFKHSII
jgi:hypothetical protein